MRPNDDWQRHMHELDSELAQIEEQEKLFIQAMQKITLLRNLRDAKPSESTDRRS